MFAVYFSRPLTVGAYLQGKLTAFIGVTALIYLLPQVALHIGLAFLSEDGFVQYLGANLDVLWKVPLVTAISSVVDRTGVAAAIFLGVLTAGGSIASRIGLLDVPFARWVTLLALDQHPRIVRDRIFEITTADYPAVQAGFGVRTSVAAVLVVAALGVWWVYHRYRKLA